MANTTMTQRMFLEMVVNANISDEMTAYAMERIKHLDDVNEHRKAKGSKTQRANAEVKKAILSSLEENTVYTASQVAEMGIEGITSTQKASALLRQMTETGELTVTDIKIKGKGKVKGYSLVSPPAQEISYSSTVEALDREIYDIYN